MSLLKINQAALELSLIKHHALVNGLYLVTLPAAFGSFCNTPSAQDGRTSVGGLIERLLRLPISHASGPGNSMSMQLITSE